MAFGTCMACWVEDVGPTFNQPLAARLGWWAKWRYANVICQRWVNNTANIMPTLAHFSKCVELVPKKHFNFFSSVYFFQSALPQCTCKVFHSLILDFITCFSIWHRIFLWAMYTRVVQNKGRHNLMFKLNKI